jgi:hypothetical protein
VIPTQKEADLSNPEEHFLWALRNMPAFAGAGMVTHPGFLRQWSSHLWQCGFAHRDWLERLADEEGNIHVSKLPRQSLKFQPAVRGPRHGYNNAARWVSSDTPDPEPINLPDIRQLTDQENQIMLDQYRSAGMIPPELPAPSKASVVND